MRRIVFVLCTLIFVTSAVTVQAQGILGEKYARAEAGYVKLGSELDKEVGAAQLMLGGKASYPVLDMIDVYATYRLSDLVGDEPDDPFREGALGYELDVTAHTIGVGALVHFAPEDQADLFFSFGLSGGTVSSGDLTLHPLSVLITLGAELRSNSPLSVRPYLRYITTDQNLGGKMEFDRLNDAHVGFDASWWLHSHLFLCFESYVSFDDKDVATFGSVGFSI